MLDLTHLFATLGLDVNTVTSSYETTQGSPASGQNETAKYQRSTRSYESFSPMP